MRSTNRPAWATALLLRQGFYRRPAMMILPMAARMLLCIWNDYRKPSGWPIRLDVQARVGRMAYGAAPCSDLAIAVNTIVCGNPKEARRSVLGRPSGASYEGWPYRLGASETRDRPGNAGFRSTNEFARAQHSVPLLQSSNRLARRQCRRIEGHRSRRFYTGLR